MIIDMKQEALLLLEYKGPIVEENADYQREKQIRGIRAYKWKKGVSGNPAGRPKGKSLKVFAREYLENLDEEEKLKFLSFLPEDLVWKMAEGNPDSKVDTPPDQTINITQNFIQFGDMNSVKKIQNEANSQ